MEEIDLITLIPGQISRHQCAELEVILYPILIIYATSLPGQ